MFKKYLLSSCLLTLSCGTIANAVGDQKSDPLGNLDYAEVSNLKHIQAKYPKVMSDLGCANNVSSGRPQKNQKLAPLQTPEAYQKECLSHLEAVRRNTILKPAYEAVVMIGLLGGGTAVIQYHQGLDSFGGSLGASSAIYQGLFQLKDGITAVYHWLKPPSHPVDSLEKKYVKDQCFIPNKLWPVIIEKFMMARQNPYEQRDSLNFLSFTLGLTHYKQPSSPEPMVDNPAAEILRNFNNFFKGYEPFKTPLARSALRKNIKYFVQSLTENESKSKTRPIFLHGEGGIGKTYFAQELVRWIQDVLPDSVSFERININSPSELEGDQSRPGVFLRVLRNKCAQRTRGSVVMMDEANWLNSSEFEAPAKRTFNGNLAKLSTTYFGKGVDGSDIELEMPPMLVLVAANLPIGEKNLESRFDTVDFPLPKEKTLQDHAVGLFEEIKGEEIEASEKENLLEAIAGKKSFRAVESIASAFYDSIEEEDQLTEENNPSLELPAVATSSSSLQKRQTRFDSATISSSTSSIRQRTETNKRDKYS